MKIEHRLVRRNLDDIIEIGNILERFYNGAAGTILRAFINGRKSEECKLHQLDPKVSAERVLGRLEAYQNIVDDIEIAIQEKTKLTEDISGGDTDEKEG